MSDSVLTDTEIAYVHKRISMYIDSGHSLAGVPYLVEFLTAKVIEERRASV
jgi:hypothetical protein